MHYPLHDAAVHGMAQSAFHACHIAAPESSPAPVKEKNNKIEHAKVFFVRISNIKFKMNYYISSISHFQHLMFSMFYCA